MNKIVRPGQRTAIAANAAKPAAGKPAAMLILGMHRSGTSALTRVISLLGADLPKNLMGATKGNERGHWESDDLVPIHERLLQALGTKWDDWRALNLEHMEDHLAAGFRNEILACLAKDFSNSSMFTVKDPRISRLLPFWLPILKDFGARTYPVIALRNPVEVAYSLHSRDGFVLEKSYLIWLRYTLDAERKTRGIKRCFVNYEDLLADWTDAADRIAEQLGITWPRTTVEAKGDIDGFLAREARHHAANDQDLLARPEISDWVKGAFLAVKSIAAGNDGPEQHRTLDEINAVFTQADLALGSVAHLALKDLAGQREQLAEKETENKRLWEILEQEREQYRQKDQEFSKAQQVHADDLKRLGQEIEARDQAQRQREAEYGKETNRLEAGYKEEIRRRDERIAVFEKLVTTEREQNSQKEGRIGQLEEWLKFERTQTQEKESALAKVRQEAAHLASLNASKDQEIGSLFRFLDEERGQKQQQAETYEGLLKAERNKFFDSEHAQIVLGGKLAALNRHVDGRNRAQASLVQELIKTRKKLRKTAPRAAKKLSLAERGLQQKIAKSGIFNAEFYREAYPDVGENIDPLRHFVSWGLIELRQPHPLFDPIWYLLTHRDIAESGVNPLSHFMRWGGIEDRDPHPLFDSSWYLLQNQDVASARMNPLSHYVLFGAREGRAPHPLFDGRWYLTQYPDAARSGLDPVSHYLRKGAAEGKNPHPLFDGNWYIQTYADVAASGQNPLLHYITAGGMEGRNPHPLFDGAWYLTKYQDVAAAGINPLIHYITAGAAEGRDPHPLFNTPYFQQQIATRQDSLS